MKIKLPLYSRERYNNSLSFKGIPVNSKYMPNIVGKIGKVFGEYVNTPEQKLFLATTALMFQPLIDLKYADEDKKTDAAIKSASKAIAGGLTGVSIRAAAIAITSHYIGFNKHNKLNRLFFPYDSIMMKENTPSLAKVRMNQYCKTLGTLFAVLFMILFSNSNVDVPLTSDIQDILTGKVKENKSWIKSYSDVKDARLNKIKNWFKNKYAVLTKIKNKIQRVIKVLFEDEENTNSSGVNK